MDPKPIGYSAVIAMLEKLNYDETTNRRILDKIFGTSDFVTWIGHVRDLRSHMTGLLDLFSDDMPLIVTADNCYSCYPPDDDDFCDKGMGIFFDKNLDRLVKHVSQCSQCQRGRDTILVKDLHSAIVATFRTIVVDLRGIRAAHELNAGKQNVELSDQTAQFIAETISEEAEMYAYRLRPEELGPFADMYFPLLRNRNI